MQNQRMTQDSKGWDIQFPEELRGEIPGYLARRIGDLDTMDAALKSRDYKTIGDIAHKIKGNAASFGLAQLGQYAADLERFCADEDSGRISEVLSVARSNLIRVKEEVDQSANLGQ